MFDGVFIHHLIEEMSYIKNIRINKVNRINDYEYFLILQNKQKLFFSLNSNNSHFRITTQDFVNSSKSSNLYQNLKRYLESGILTNITQYQNDRIIELNVISFDELGYKKEIKLVLEFFGRNANLILVDENNIIIDCLKKLFPTANDDRIILPKTIYKYPLSDKINPFETDTVLGFNNYQGVSSLCFEEIKYHNSIDVIKRATKPLIIKGTKTYFYCFEINYLKDSVITTYTSLSQLLESFYEQKNINASFNQEQDYLSNYIKREIEKINNKHNKQLLELEKARDNLKYEEIGNIFASNLYRSNKGDSYIDCENYYDNNNIIRINLDKELTPNQNLESFFSKYNKAKRAILFINDQLAKNENDLLYYECLLDQLKISKVNDLKEIYQELNIKQSSNNRKQSKPNYLVYHSLNGDTILVGKNNVQNNYITHKLANKDDYFFHVQNIPGSHTILKTKELTPDNIKLAATIAAYYSKYTNSTNVCVDYTLIKFVRKVPGINGSFVTYKNQKSIFVKPDFNFIKDNTKNN